MFTNKTKIINPDEVKFIAQETYQIKLKMDEVMELNKMLFFCLQYSDPSNELEIMILDEIRQELGKKYNINNNKAKLKLKRSESRTLFLWLNQVDFMNGYCNDLAQRIVQQIYKQIF